MGVITCGWFVILLFMIISNRLQAAAVTVHTAVGPIKGKIIEVSIDRRDKRIPIVEFLGIPYAEPPIGNLRFAKPVPKAIFTSTFDALAYGLPCTQYIAQDAYGTIKIPTITSEDCLSLNIYTPDVGEKDKSAVMLFIHGGQYIIGESKAYSGHVLSAYSDVVVVTINYRLAAFGFLSTEDDLAPGNAGLWDQHLAIKWVKDNIESFGGDASRITLFGESAGASSVGSQTLYKGNKDYINRGILQSGSVNAYWTVGTPGGYLDSAKQLATKCACSIPEIDSGKEILKCLREIHNASEIAVHANGLSWFPRVDEDFITSESLSSVDWSPTNSHVSSSVFSNYDVIVGLNGYDAHYFLATWYKNMTDEMKVVPKHMAVALFKDFIKEYLKKMFPNVEISETILDATLFLYTDSEQPNDRHFFLKQVNDFLTDVMFFEPVIKDVSIHSQMNNKTKTYQYEFNHMFPYFQHGRDWLKGAPHVTELLYVFGFPSSMKSVIEFTDDQAKSEWPTSAIIMDYWTNFAKSGNPNSPRKVPTEWKPYNNDKQDFLYFPITGSAQAKHHLNARRATFWVNYLPQLMEDVCD